MTAAELAALHALVFTVPRPYSEAEFAAFLNTPTCFFCFAPQGFALGRVSADEAELLTLAVAPGARRSGVGRALLQHYEADASERGAYRSILEVAANNAPALGLYQEAGYAEIGRRPNYYRFPGGDRSDALVLAKTLLRPGDAANPGIQAD